MKNILAVIFSLTICLTGFACCCNQSLFNYKSKPPVEVKLKMIQTKKDLDKLICRHLSKKQVVRNMLFLYVQGLNDARKEIMKPIIPKYERLGFVTA